MTERTPAMVFSLAEMLGDEMAARGWTIEDAGARMSENGAARDSLILATMMSVQSDGLILTDDFFSGLSRAFDVSEDFFRNIHRQWLAHPSARQPYDAPDELFGPWLRVALTPVSVPAAREGRS
jgi:hypothetical protein